jgi:hypothetical protein
MKLEWYRKNEPEKMQAVKDLLLCEVQSSPSFMNVPYNHVKLLPYCTDTINTPARPEPRQDIMLADDILGLGANNLLAYHRILQKLTHIFLTLKLAPAFFRFKVRQYHVRESSPQEKRRRPHNVITLAQSLWRLCKCSNLQYAKARV